MLREIGKINHIILSIASGLTLSLSFLNPYLSLTAYFSFVLLFFAIRGISKREAFFLSYLCGFIFYGATIFWLRHVSILGGLLLISILSVFFGLLGVYFQSAIRRPGLALFLVPAIWITMEYIRSNLFTGFGWALLGHSQYLNLPLIQIADITGAYGVSFIAMIVNVVIYILLSGKAKEGARAFFVCLLVLCGTLGYGYLRLHNAETAKGTLRISLIQGNIPQKMKWDSEYIDYIWNVYSTLTEEASRDNPDLIIWPETALPGYMEDEELFKAVARLARNTKSALLIGAPSYRESDETIFNSAYLIGEEGDIIQRYDKLHLVPFGEYIPFDRYIGFIRKFVNKPIGTFGKGDEYTIFELKNGLRFGVLICYEDIFATLVRRFAARDADFMVNITNDAWFMKTAAPYQHAQSSVFRAVENRAPFVRATNTGLSCFIDRTGRIFDSVRVGADEIFVAGYKTNKIDLFNTRSPYTRFGNIFVFFCALSVIVDSALSRRTEL